MPREKQLLDEVRVIGDRIYTLDKVESEEPLTKVLLDERAALIARRDKMLSELEAIHAATC